jgi:hypothetical protein
MAERSPHVGKSDIQMLVANRERADLLPDQQADRSGCSVSLTELKDWLEGYGPKKTDDLELPEPSE